MKTVLIKKDAVYKGKKLAEMSQSEIKRAEKELKAIHLPNKIKIVYENN